MVQQQNCNPHPQFDNDTHEGERHCNIRPEDVPSLGLLHGVFTGGSFQAGPGQEHQMLPASLGRQGLSPVHPQHHQGFDATFAQGIIILYTGGL